MKKTIKKRLPERSPNVEAKGGMALSGSHPRRCMERVRGMASVDKSKIEAKLAKSVAMMMRGKLGLAHPSPNPMR